MKYSIKNSKLKPIISNFNKICIMIYIIVILVIISVTKYFDLYINNNIKQQIQINKEIIITDDKLIKKNKDILEYEKKYLDLANDINASNINLKKSIKNILDLVPDDITLYKISLDKNSLIINGYTPNKESYELIFEKTLSSIFNKTNTKFIKNNNGYDFISYNKITNSEGFNE